MNQSGWKRSLRLAIAAVACIGTTAAAQSSSEMTGQRCASRLSIALLGTGAANNLMTAASPQTQIPAMLEGTAFVERFSRFVNSEFNMMPGATTEEDAAYWLTREIISKKLPWKDLFVGAYRVERNNNTARVVADPEGLGYFRSPAWLARYAGNEEDGYKISTAYRILQNTLGLKLIPSVNAPDADISSSGRRNQPCASCHYEGPFALDLVARVLTRKNVDSDPVTFRPSTEAPQQILGGVTIRDDKELVTALVNSADFRFNACQLVFKYLYGRSEYTCNGPVFDKCMDAFAADGRIQTAITAVASDASFCE